MRVALALTLLLSLPAVLVRAAGLPANPGFEQLDQASGLPADWSPRGQVPGFQKLATTSRSGQHAAEITIAPGASNPTGYYYSRPEPLAPARRLTVSVWTRVQAASGGAYLKLYYATGPKLDAYLSHQCQSQTLTDTKGEWQQLTIVDTPPVEATGWRMSVEFTGAGTALFDDALAELTPLAVLSGVSLTTPSGKAVALGEGCWGVLGPVMQPVAGQRVVATLQGRSAVPQPAQVGVVWFQGARQLGVASASGLAWQSPQDVTMPVRALPGADRFRPIAYAESAAAWAALTATGLRAELIPDATAATVRLAPSPHPRLFVNAAELQHVRQLLKTSPPAPLAAAYKELLAQADACFTEKEIVAYGKYRVSLPPSVPERHPDNFPYWTGLSRAIEIRIEALATIYLLTGERKYAELAKTWMLAVCDWPQWTDPDLDIADACLDTGHFCYAGAFTYDFCYDVLTDAERVKLRRALLDKGAQAVMRAGETGWAQTMSWPNGFAVVMGGMGIAGLATLGDDPGADRYVQVARRRLYEFLSAQDRDGGYVEGLLYGGYAISFTVPFAATLASHGDPWLINHPYLAKTLRMAITCLAPDGATSVNFCDASSTSRDYASLAAWRARHGDGLGLWYLQRSGHLQKLYEWTPPLGVLWYPDQARLQSPDTLSAAAVYRDVGWAILRSGFTPDDFLLAFRCANVGSHCHADANSFMLNGNGEWLLRDPGYGVGETARHSTLLVNGAGQGAFGAQLTAFGSVGDLIYTAGDASGCYTGLKRFVRHVMMVDRRYALIVDEVAAEGAPVAVTSQLVTGLDEPSIASGRLVELSAKHGYYLTALTPGALAVSPAAGPKTLSLSYEATSETKLTPLLLNKVQGDGESANVECTANDRAAVLTLRYGSKTDRLFLNVTDGAVTLDDVTTDARVALVREAQGKVAKVAVVWGSQVKLSGREILRRAVRGDYATGR